MIVIPTKDCLMLSESKQNPSHVLGLILK